MGKNRSQVTDQNELLDINKIPDNSISVKAEQTQGKRKLKLLHDRDSMDYGPQLKRKVENIVKNIADFVKKKFSDLKKFVLRSSREDTSARTSSQQDGINQKARNNARGVGAQPIARISKSAANQNIVVGQHVVGPHTKALAKRASQVAVQGQNIGLR